MACGVVAFAVCLVVTPIVSHACRRFAILDQPGPLKLHRRPVPRLGGIAIALAIAVGSITGCGISRIDWSIAVTFLIVLAVGLIDDVAGLRPIIRLFAQTASAIFLWQAGLRLAPTGNVVFSIFATCVFIVAFVNAFNFLDGADGLAAGVSCIVAIAFIVLPNDLHSPFSYPLACSIAGASAAFVLFNFPPARIFMGDSGSTLLGFGLALVGLRFSAPPQTSSLQTAEFLTLAAAVPLVDAAFAVIRRMRYSRSPFEGDRRHSYDLMLARGWPPRKVALLWYAITSMCAIAAWLAVRTNTLGIFLSAVVFAVLALAGLRLGCLRVRDNLSSSSPPTVENSALIQ